MDLSEILVCFNAPIKEEQAWAVCHLCGKYLQNKRTKEKPIPNGTKSIKFDEDGIVTIDGKFVDDETKIVSNLGLTLFSALDYGLSADEEQLLSEDLELLISSMTGQLPCSEDDVDEGYADTKFSDVTIDHVVALCEKHLPPTIDAGSHYLAVCRALVHEALELQVFLGKIVSANKCLQNLSGSEITQEEKTDNDVTALNYTEWAQIWVQVLDQLRKGVTNLRRVEKQNCISVEYELTPYEILMEDIRQKKYTLKKVTANDRLPYELKRNAHDVILDFIRSRPNLSPAHERILAPVPPRSKSLHEKLLEQIQEQTVSLKHVEPSQTDAMKRSSSDEFNVTSCQRRRLKPSLIVEDVESLQSDESLSDVEDLELFVSDGDCTGDVSSLPLSHLEHDSSLRSSGTSGVSSSYAGDIISSANRPFKLGALNNAGRKRLLPLELLPSPKSPEDATIQRRTFSGGLFSSFRRPVGIPRCQSACISNLQKPEQNDIGFNWTEEARNRKDINNLTSTPKVLPTFRRTFSERRFPYKNDKKCGEPTMRLSFDEVVHIRQVLARAQLEKYQSSKDLYQALKNEKICFCCRIKKFNLFTWPSTCQMCKRKVCGKCLKKVRFPVNDFDNRLVFSLSPALTPLVLEKKEFFKKTSIPVQLVTETPSPDVTLPCKKMDVCLDCHVVLSVESAE